MQELHEGLNEWLLNTYHPPQTAGSTPEVLKLLRKLEIKHIHVNFFRVKTHVGIYGNEKIDKLAKSASLNQLDQPLCVTSDTLASVKTSIWNKLQNIYRSNDKGKYFKNINPLPKSLVWFESLSNKRDL
ncbi:hypothetical protein WA026_011157, partial [Henosepilachna vigintioctopunctata]